MPKDSSATPEHKVVMTVNEIEGFSTGRFSTFCQCTVKEVLSLGHDSPGGSKPKINDQVIVIGGSFYRLRSLVQGTNVSQETCFCVKVVPNNNSEHAETTPWYATYIHEVYSKDVKKHQESASPSKLYSLVDRLLGCLHEAVEANESPKEMRIRIQSQMHREGLDPIGIDNPEYERRVEDAFSKIDETKDAIDAAITEVFTSNAKKIASALGDCDILNGIPFPTAKEMIAILKGETIKPPTENPEGLTATVGEVVKRREEGDDGLAEVFAAAAPSDTTTSPVRADTPFGE